MKIIDKVINNKLLMEIIKFGITGGISFIVDYGLFFVLDIILGVNYLLSTAISFSVSVIVNYVLCVAWVFEDANRSDKKTMVVFILTSVVGLILNLIFMWLFVNVFEIKDMISKIIATVLVMIWNYLTKKKAVTK